MSAERLQKLLAAAGIASRRHSEELIIAGRVRVDGRVVMELGARADAAAQRIEVDGRPLALRHQRRSLLLNKPAGYVTTAADPQGRPTVFDLLPPGPRLFTAGRLDYATEGLLLLTDDGELAYRVTHPRYGLDKEYYVWTDASRPEQRRALADGVVLEDGPAAPARIQEVAAGRRAQPAILSLTIHEGRNRQVRRMFQAVGLPVYRLQRVRIGPLRLGALAAGEWRDLRPDEVACLRRLLGLPSRKDASKV